MEWDVFDERIICKLLRVNHSQCDGGTAMIFIVILYERKEKFKVLHNFNLCTIFMSSFRDLGWKVWEEWTTQIRNPPPACPFAYTTILNVSFGLHPTQPKMYDVEILQLFGLHVCPVQYVINFTDKPRSMYWFLHLLNNSLPRLLSWLSNAWYS